MSILEKIANCIIEMDEDNIEALIIKAINMKDLPLEEIYSKGLNFGMVKAIDMYEKKLYDIPEIIVCADILNKGLNVLRKYGIIENKSKGKIVLAVVSGDTHEIGKNIVKIMFEAAGYEVLDMGVNRNIEDIIEMAIRNSAEIIGLSSMMTTTRGEMKKLIERLKEINIPNKPKVIVGGGSVTKSFSEDIKADGYSPNAPLAVKLVDYILSEVN